LSQAHNDDVASNVSTSPPIGFEFLNEKLRVNVLHCPSGQNPNNDAGNTKTVTIWTAASTARGVWHEIKIEAKNKNDTTGYCKVWLNGVQVANYTGPVGYGYPLYWDVGPYRATDPTVFAARYRNIVHTWLAVFLWPEAIVFVRDAHMRRAIGLIVDDEGAAEIETWFMRVAIGPFALPGFQFDQWARALNGLARHCDALARPNARTRRLRRVCHDRDMPFRRRRFRARPFMLRQARRLWPYPGAFATQAMNFSDHRVAWFPDPLGDHAGRMIRPQSFQMFDICGVP
jgi:hypothetical protein